MPSKCIICKIKQSFFGRPDDKVATCCNSCKTDDMINIRSRKCLFCKIKQPFFGKPHDKVATCCNSCKTDDMINIRTRKCIICKIKRPVFGKPDDKVATCCNSCKQDDMIDIKHPKCMICKIKRPTFGKPDDKVANYCGTCKTDDMIDIKSPRCKSERCSTIVNKKYDGYCAYCYREIFPDKPMARNHKIKEISVLKFIKTIYTDIDIISDKPIQGGYSKKRPDIFIDLGEQVIIIEVDENKHKSYDCTGENKRLMELSQDVKQKPIVFIRFNPDNYKTINGKVTSCWGTNENGVCVIKKTKEKEWDERLQTLQNTIDYWIKNKTSKLIEIIQLYYNA